MSFILRADIDQSEPKQQQTARATPATVAYFSSYSIGLYCFRSGIAYTRITASVHLTLLAFAAPSNLLARKGAVWGFDRPPDSWRFDSAVAEGPRDARCQLKSAPTALYIVVSVRLFVSTVSFEPTDC